MWRRNTMRTVLRFEREQCHTLRWKKFVSLSSAPCEGDMRVLGADDLARLSEDEYRISRRFVRGLEARSDLCLGLFREGHLANYAFYSTLPTPWDQALDFECPRNWIYIYKVFTHPRQRGLRLHMSGFRLARTFIENWLPRVISHQTTFAALIRSHNLPSLKSFRRMGFRLEGTFPVLSFCGFGTAFGQVVGPARLVAHQAATSR